jgi:hypothetical protein
MKILFFIICLLTITTANQTWAGTDIQNGGGGLSINGNVATFFTARINIDPEPMEIFEDIHNLNQELFNLAVTSPIKFSLLNNTTPSFSRQYFKATETNSQQTIESIKEEYIKATGLSSKDIVLFAITNVQERTTLLLPDFFKLNSTEKMAILFHESMWLSSKVDSLREMLRLEYVFQQYLENKSPKNIFDLYRKLEETFANTDLLLKAVAKSEIAIYSKKPNASALTLDKILSVDSIDILAKYLLSEYTDVFGQRDEVASELAARVIMDQYNNPAFQYTLKSFVIHVPNNIGKFWPCKFTDSIANLKLHDVKQAARELSLGLQKVSRISLEGNGIIAYSGNSNEVFMTCERRLIEKM